MWGIDQRRTMARTGRRRATARPQEALDDAVLEAVESHHRQPAAGFGLSVATWAGLIGYAKTLSLEVGPDNITVNTICPGRIDTPLSQRGFERAAKGDAARAREMLDTLIRSTPLKRIGAPDDIAGAVAFLASPQASFITGVTLPIDGGRSAALL